MRRFVLAAATSAAAVAALFGFTSFGDALTGSGSSSSTDAGAATYSGSADMQYGTVTVTITVTNGEITAAEATQDSSDGKSEQIAGQAIPTLNDEAVSAQSADIAMVSHATYTSEAYAQALQQAIDAANL